MRVLVVEDEVLLADALATGLRREAVAVDVVHDGWTALQQIDVNDYDVIILDRDLPGIHGDDVCRAVTSSSRSVMVLMLTAAAELTDRVTGLSLGADDYLAKPFAFAELVARVRALGRRARPNASPVIERAGLTVNPSRREVIRAGAYIPLSLKEFAVLEELLRADGAIVSAEQLLERAWDENIDPFTNVIRVAMHSLRCKLGDPPLIRTVRGAGYQIP